MKVLKLHEDCYKALGISGHRYRLSKHDPQKINELEGSLENWLLSENILRICLVEMKLEFYEADGEAAFYGPKIDIQMRFFNEKQNLKEESISSIQLDFLSPERFNLEFIDAYQQKIRPWVIHRAPLGSHERFIALLLEYYDGQLPGWLCPVQLLIFPLNEKAFEFAKSIQEMLGKIGVRVKIDNRSANLGKRIALGRKLRPFAFMIIGEKELNSEEFIIQFRSGEEIILYNELLNVLGNKLKIPH